MKALKILAWLKYLETFMFFVQPLLGKGKRNATRAHQQDLGEI